MHWVVKLPDGRELQALGANPQEAAKFVDHELAKPLPGQTVHLQVRRNVGRDLNWSLVALHGECQWTATPRQFG